MPFVFMVLVLAAYAIISSGVMWLAWNGVVPAVFGLPRIEYVQAFCLIVLVGLLQVGLPSVSADSE